MAENKVNERQVNDETVDIVMGAVVARLQGLLDILELLDMEADMLLSKDANPYIEARSREGAVYFFSYIPVDINGLFILQVSREVTSEEIDKETILINVASFNMGSDFGFAVYDPVDDKAVLRAQVPEQGAISLEWYSYILKLFNDSYAELEDALRIDDAEEV